ncbi:MAG: nucleoside monophosphate kinase [Chloroflexi bacterium]|nr:nucleoside monophosphate kinase [Chloroflexota bacterium]
MGLYLLLLGVQGAGKGEQARYVRETYSIPHVSTGDLFRAMQTRDDALARRVQQILNEGRLVDDDTTNEIVRERLEQPDAQGGVVLDGYPRSIGQAQWLDAYLSSRGEKIASVLLLELDLFTAFQRAFGRVSSVETGQSYNIYSNSDGIEWAFVESEGCGNHPPRLHATLTETGEVLKRRPDDANAHAIIKRINAYQQTTMPLVEYYNDQGALSRINAAQPIEDVSAQINAVIAQVRV